MAKWDKLWVRGGLARETEKRFIGQERSILLVDLLLTGIYAKVQGNPAHLDDAFLGIAGALLLIRLIR